MNKPNVKTKDRELILTRDFDAPIELLFDMWSDCKHLKNWWGARSWPMHECSLNFQEGGVWHFCLRGPNEGDETWVKSIYQMIKKPVRIVYKDHFSDKDGNINKKIPSMRVMVEFIEKDGKTRQICKTVFASSEILKKVVGLGIVNAMTESLERLDEYLEQISGD